MRLQRITFRMKTSNCTIIAAIVILNFFNQAIQAEKPVIFIDIALKSIELS